LEQSFLDLVEDVFAVSILECGHLLNGLRHKIDERVIEALPLHVNVVSRNRHIESKLGTVSHVGELAETLLENACPDPSEDGCLWDDGETAVCSVKLATNNTLRLLELVILFVPEICDAIPLLDELRSL
jgi:hypothetical protein